MVPPLDPYRVPRFAVCAVCGASASIAGCPRCKLLCCVDCRTDDECAACVADRKRAAQRALRKQRMSLVGEGVALVAGVTMSTMAAVGMMVSVGRLAADVLPTSVVLMEASPSESVPGHPAALPGFDESSARTTEARRLRAEAHRATASRVTVGFTGHALSEALDRTHSCAEALSEIRSDAPTTDAWGEPLLIGCAEEPRVLVVASRGADGRLGTDDDVVFTEQR